MKSFNSRYLSRYLVPGAFLAMVYLVGCGGSENDMEAAEAAAAPVQEEHAEGGRASAESVAAGQADPGSAEAEGRAEGEHAEGQHAGEGAGLPAEVHLGAERARELGIRVATVEGGSARSVVLRPATLRMDPDRRALVGPRIEAKVVRVSTDLGSRVEQGETLAILSSVEVGRAKSHYLTARARLNTQQRDYEREQSLFERQISSEAEYLEAEAEFTEARAELDAARETLRLYGLDRDAIAAIEAGGESPLSHFALRSPVGGRIQRRDVSPGQTLGPNDTPIHVADVEVLWAMIEAYDQDVPLLQEGRPVEITVRNVPGRTFDGEIDWVSYELDPETRTLEVRAVVENEDGLLRSGMYGTARMNLSADVRNALVPVDAIQTLAGQDVVFVPGHEEGAFRPVPVELGSESQEGWVEVLSGLQPGDEAVVEGAFDLMSTATATGRSAAHSH